MKRFFKQLALLITALTIFLSLCSIGFAATESAAAPSSAQDSETPTAPSTAQDFIRTIGEPTLLPSFETAGHANASAEPGAAGITSIIFIIIDLIKYLIGTIAVLYIVIAGVRLVTAGKHIDDITTKQKENFKWLVIGLFVIILSDTIVTKIFGQEGETFSSPSDIAMSGQSIAEEIEGIINVGEMFVGALAVLMFIIAGIRLIGNFGNDEVMTKVKSSILYGVLGIMLIGISELIVKDIVFKSVGNTLPDVDRFNVLIVELTTFAAAFIGIVAVPILIYGGYLYLASGINEELKNKGKKVIFGAVIGILIALGAYAIVNSVIEIKDFEIAPESSTQIIK